MKNVLILLGLLAIVSGCSSSVRSNQNTKEQLAITNLKKSFAARMFKSDSK